MRLSTHLFPQEKEQQLYSRLKNLSYGDNGYLYGYNSQGVRTLLGSSDKGIGSNYWNLKDKKENLFIQEIIRKAKQGGGYVEYYFPKPGQSKAQPKLSYSLYLPELDWIIGTGVYIDHIEAQLKALRQKQSTEFKSCMLHSRLGQ